MKQLFATTARGFEELLKSELTELCAQDAKVAQGGVHYWADDETLYRTLLWSRLSSRILLPIVQAKVFSDLDLYSAVVGMNWLDYFDEKVHFFVDFNGTNQEIRHTQFGAMRVKDGIVDYFERHGRWRINSAPLITIRRHTHTCYNGVEGGCGECPSCVLRERGLKAYSQELETKNI